MLDAVALAVLVTLNRNPVNVTPLAFQVCAKSSTGALAASVPLLAVSVVKVPAAGVVLPMAGGEAALKPAAKLGAAAVPLEVSTLPESPKASSTISPLPLE